MGTRSANKSPIRLDQHLGMPPQAFRGGPYDPEEGLLDDDVPLRFSKPGRAAAGKRTTANRSKSKFNLRGVIEVLEEFGLDPIAELAGALKQTEPVLDSHGKPVMERVKAGNGRMVERPKQKPALGLSQRVQVLTALTEYVHPKLKSVEMTVKKPELSDDQVEQRLAALLLQAQLNEAKKS